MKSCVVGIGAMGLEMALHIQNKGMDVVGVDLDEKQIAEAKKRGLSASDDLASQVRSRIDRAYALLFQRSPSEEERQAGLEFLHQDGSENSAQRWPQYAQVLLGTHEFMQVE